MFLSIVTFNKQESLNLFNKTRSQNKYLFKSYHTSINSDNSKPSKAFMAMFMGFMDGDGYFDIGEQKQYSKAKVLLTPDSSTIRIRLASNVHSRDLPLLEYFIKVLGVGSMSKMSKRDQVRVIFSKKDIVDVILPLIKLYNLKFLTVQRAKQFSLLTYILENDIRHWHNVKFEDSTFIPMAYHDLLSLDFFDSWIVGFTIAEGCFISKAMGGFFYQVKQSGIENSYILRAIYLKITGREINSLNPSDNSYQISLSSKLDIEKVVCFFSNKDSSKNITHPLCGYKHEQYILWISELKKSKRYSKIDFSE